MKKQYLAEFMHNRKNNLDIIRFLAAVLVLYSHSYPLILTNNKQEPFFMFSNQMTFGGLAVALFFIISGFLITQSYERSSSIINYFKSRILRIFPALLFCLLFSTFILGVFMTTLPIFEYLTNSLTYKYLIGITLLPNISPSLPGVFENNPYGSFVNGSLWTLKYEFICYIGIAIIGVINLLNKKIVCLLFVVSVTLSIIDIQPHLDNLFMLSSYFFGGTLIYLLRDKVKIKGIYAVASLLILFLTSQVGFFEQSVAIFGTYLIIYLGYQRHISFHNFTKYGDLSYGVYIYAFPIQQAIITLFGSDITPLQNFAMSLPIIAMLAFLSWHLIEKRALQLKHITFKTESKSLAS